MMSETELGNLNVVSPFMLPSTSLSSASANRVSDCLTLSASLAQCTPQENNNLTEYRLEMIKGIFLV